MAKRERRARIAFIGGGAMGEAMIRGILTKKVAVPQDMVVSDVSPVRRELLSKEYGLSTLADNRKAIENADLIVLAVKPQNLRQVAEEIRAPSPEQLVLSILAGGTLSKLCQDLNHSSVVRAAPNMPAQIGQGITVWTATTETNKKQKELARAVLSALGKEIYVADEKYLDMVTALGGSGAAYVFLFIEAFIDAGASCRAEEHGYFTRRDNYRSSSSVREGGIPLSSSRGRGCCSCKSSTPLRTG
jgi:pyrroline-5-carboxylate reductase